MFFQKNPFFDKKACGIKIPAPFGAGKNADLHFGKLLLALDNRNKKLDNLNDVLG